MRATASYLYEALVAATTFKLMTSINSIFWRTILVPEHLPIIGAKTMILLQIIIEGVPMRFESDGLDLIVIVSDFLTGRG